MALENHFQKTTEDLSSLKAQFTTDEWLINWVRVLNEKDPQNGQFDGVIDGISSDLEGLKVIDSDKKDKMDANEYARQKEGVLEKLAGRLNIEKLLKSHTQYINNVEKGLGEMLETLQEEQRKMLQEITEFSNPFCSVIENHLAGKSELSFEAGRAIKYFQKFPDDGNADVARIKQESSDIVKNIQQAGESEADKSIAEYSEKQTHAFESYVQLQTDLYQNRVSNCLARIGLTTKKREIVMESLFIEIQAAIESAKAEIRRISTIRGKIIGLI